MNIKKWRTIIYTICFCGLCICDQRVESCSGLDGWLKTFQILPVLLMSVMLLVNCRVEEIVKWRIPYLIWTACSVLGGGATIWKGMEEPLFLNVVAATVLSVMMLGYVVIYTFLHVFMERNKPQLNKKAAAVWCVMMLLMVFSRNDQTWPLYYLLMFGCFYLTSYDEQGEKELFTGMLNGIILGFFLLQGLAFVCRPYDKARYFGMYRNPNRNAIFYLEVLAAVLIRLIGIMKKQGHKWEQVFYRLGTGVLLSFVFMTIGRTAWAVATLLILVFLWGSRKILQRKCFRKNGMLVLLCAVLMFPVCFGMARYIPPVFHHPLWFWGEWGPDKVHADDPWDSEKYIDMDELLDGAVGRIIKSMQDVLEHSPFAMQVNATEIEPMLTDEEGADGVLVRKTIYETYWKQLNLNGHREEELKFYLTKYYEVPHAHNIYLQFGMEFGIPVMILFIGLMGYALGQCIVKVKKYGNIKYMTFLVFLFIPAVFGLLEYSWGVGSLSLFMMFWSWRGVMWKNLEES